MFKQDLSILEQQHLLRRLTIVDAYDGPRVTIKGKSVLLMCSNDYLGLAGHPALREAARKAMDIYGFGSGGSRLVSGTSAVHRELEQRLAAFKGTEAALVFNSGYAANTGIIPALTQKGDVILSDCRNHASIVDGCRLSKAERTVYRHKDMNHLEYILKESRDARQKLIVTDGVFSMDGDLAPLPELVRLAEQYNAILMLDDAHGTGVLGKTGKGTVEHFGLSGSVHIQMGTLGKAFGSFGAYVAGSKDLIAFLVNHARSFIYSTALPPAVCAASLAAIDLVEHDPSLREKLWKNRERFVAGLTSYGLSVGESATPIVPIIIGDSERAWKAGEKLIEYGAYATAIRPPTVSPGTARIRATVTAAHSDQDIDAAIGMFRKLRQEEYL
jgi:8-amino-7-oxononanoate synthase